MSSCNLKGSTSSVSGVLSHIYFALSNFKRVRTKLLSSHFKVALHVLLHHCVIVRYCCRLHASPTSRTNPTTSHLPPSSRASLCVTHPSFHNQIVTFYTCSSTSRRHLQLRRVRFPVEVECCRQAAAPDPDGPGQVHGAAAYARREDVHAAAAAPQSYRRNNRPVG